MATRISWSGKLRVGLAYTLQLGAIILLVMQVLGVGLFDLANIATGRIYIILLMVMGSFGSALLNNTIEKAIITGIGSFLTQFLIVVAFGNVAVLDAMQNNEGFMWSESRAYFMLDGLSGLSEQVAGVSGIVNLVAQLVPTAVLVWGIIGILLSDSPDEMTTPIIEIIISIGVLALYYGLGNWLGFA